MREAAENLTITDGAADRERGIILSEERARDTPGFRSLMAQLAFLYPETLLPTRLPIGDMDIVSGPEPPLRCALITKTIIALKTRW